MSYRSDVARYLLANYVVDTQTVALAMADPEVTETIATAERLQSFPFYPGDQIAAGHGWDERDDVDENTYDGRPESDDEWDDAEDEDDFL